MNCNISHTRSRRMRRRRRNMGRRRTRRSTGTGGGGLLAAEGISAAGYSASEGGEAGAAGE